MSDAVRSGAATSGSVGGGRYLVRPAGPLSGRVRVSGMTKNAGLKQMAAALLTSGTTTLTNMPRVEDLDVMIEVFRAIGADVAHDDGPSGGTVTIDTSGSLVPEAPYELVTRMRASVNVLGPLLARCGEARVAMPGGDNIGSRKLDMHLRGLTAMGATVEVLHGFIEARADGLTGTHVMLEFPSVGTTENLLTAGVLAKGTTAIDNAAREPEIVDLAAMLTEMGASIIGAGTPHIEIEGVEELSPTSRSVIPDRIEAGTLLMACAVAGGEVELVGARIGDFDIVARKLVDMGMEIEPTATGLRAAAPQRLRAIDLATLPFPGFATDFMPPAVAALATAEGTGIVTENVFDSRLGFCDELNRMGADVRTEGRHAVVRGVDRLSAAPVRALDVRAGAALVLAGLAADGETEVLDTFHIDRGYPDLPASLRALGADVDRA